MFSNPRPRNAPGTAAGTIKSVEIGSQCSSQRSAPTLTKQNRGQSKHSIRRHASAFSLVEMMVVLVIIGLLASIVTISVRNQLAIAKRNTAKMEIATICDALETYYTVHDRYPGPDEGLTVLTAATDKLPEALLQSVPIDPWGREYQYVVPGRNAPYEVITFGSDGREGGDGVDKDILSSELSTDR